MELKKGTLFKKVINHSHPLKLRQTIKIFHSIILQQYRHINITEALRKLHMHLEILSCLGYGPKRFKV